MGYETASLIPAITDILTAQRRIQDVVRNTPVLTDSVFNDRVGCDLWLKCENLQHTGAFKFRGASNALACMDETGQAGDVATHSSGNHGAALALAASQHQRRSWIVMPENSVRAKIEAVKRNGGRVILCPPTQKDREKALEKLVKNGCIPVHPFDNFDVICGQGTATLEILEQIPDVEILLTPVGGGGLISGTAIAGKKILPGVLVTGAEPLGAADTALSLGQGKRVDHYQVDTIADGLRTIVGVRNFKIIQKNIDRVITVSEQGIIDAMALVWQHFRLLIEPSSATVIAAIIAQPDYFAGKKTAAIISGGNVDLSELPFTP